MAFPTSGLVANLVHKEGNQTFVYDATSGSERWDQVKDADSQQTGTSGESITFPSGHIIQVLSNTDSAERTITQPGTTALKAVQMDITSTVANSKFYITANMSVAVVASHFGVGLFLNGLANSSNMIFTPSHADTAGGGNGWHGWYVQGINSYQNPSLSFLYGHPSGHAVGTNFTFYAGLMGYNSNGASMVNRTSNSTSGRSTITIFEIMP